MTQIAGETTSSGVFIAKDFRDNLIIDRFDPIFVGMRASKLRHMRSANSEDVLSWNVFRTLRQIDPSFWGEALFMTAFNQCPKTDFTATTIDLWKPVAPPSSLLEEGDEGISEIDIVVEHPKWVFFLEAKLTSDISTGTTTRPERDQLLRNIDVGSYYAGVRDFYFALLVQDEARSPKGMAKIREYSDPLLLRERLPHRIDGLKNLRGIGLITWSVVASLLSSLSPEKASTFEMTCAQRCLGWLRERKM
jgi:hypothetical protein